MKTLLQIVPHVPGGFDGVGDYALNLARLLSRDYGIVTIFGVAEKTTLQSVDGFALRDFSPTVNLENLTSGCDAALFHYVNYGYHPRGIPMWLPRVMRSLQRSFPGVLVTIFHELYASGPPWGSAFWLQPIQKQIARNLSRLSARNMVSNALVLQQLERFGSRASLQPVPSNFGEPVLTRDQISKRDPHRWTICGGTALVERSLRSFSAVWRQTPPGARPRELFVLGGNESIKSRSLLENFREMEVAYYPEISSTKASEILSTCAFSWLDYFRQRQVPTVAILKSTSFAACCAHAVIPIFPEAGSPVAVDRDQLPGPYFLTTEKSELPDDCAKAREAVYDWYRRNAALSVLAKKVAELAGFIGPAKPPE